MVENEKLHRICPQCKGAGILVRRNFDSEGIPIETEIVCPGCNGEKVVLWGEIDNSTIINKLDYLITEVDKIKKKD